VRNHDVFEEYPSTRSLHSGGLSVADQMASIQPLETTLTPSSWIKFQFYGDFVRVLTVSHESRISADLALAVASFRPVQLTPTLLPKLRKLGWCFGEHSKANFPLFLSPDLEELEMSQSNGCRDLVHASVCHALTTCQRLRSLSVASYNSKSRLELVTESRNTEAMLINWLGGAQVIENLGLSVPQYLSPITIKLLASLPRLGRLTLGCSKGTYIPVLEGRHTPHFASLRHLDLTATISIAQDFARFKLSLTSLKFRCLGVASARDIQRWLEDTNASYGSSLHEFEFDVEIDGDEEWGGVGLAAFVSGLPLTRLKLNIKAYLRISDETLKELGAAAPTLEDVEISSLDDIDRELTIWGIFGLLSQCPRMQSLRMLFTATVHEKDVVGDPSLPKHALAELHVGSSSVEDSVTVAELLSEVLPQLQVLTWDMDEGQYDTWEDNDEIKWSYIWKLQRSFRRVRERAGK
jgi:hypothetical protein